MPRTAITTCLFALAAALPAQQGYYRQPTIQGDVIVFVSEGDLWRVSADGGPATRLTTHPSDELHPKLSPDGRSLAFIGNYEGSPEVYTMPLAGGRPTRHTFGAGRGVIVAGWTPDGRLLYSSTGESALPANQLFLLDLDGGTRTRLPLDEGWEGAVTGDGATLVFTHHRHVQHCKRYRGGTAERLWRFGLDARHEAVPLTDDHPGTSHHPMIWGDRVVFVSDRDDSLNVWSMGLDGKDLRQHTRHAGWDVMEADNDGARVVYRVGADLHVLNLGSGDDRRLEVRLQSDFDQARERWIEKPFARLSAVHLSPDGDRIVLTARGQVFVAPVKKHAGPVQALVRGAGTRYRDARFLPGKDRVAVMSDASGEVELWSLPADGSPGGRQHTRGGRVLRGAPVPSPDGTWVAWSDKNAELWLIHVATGTLRRLDRGERALRGLAWTPDGRWLAAARSEPNGYSVVRLYDAKSGRALTVSSDRYHSHTPAFGPEGRWLYFLSDRHFQSRVRSPWGAHQPEPYFPAKTGIYALALADGLRFPFLPGKSGEHPEKVAGDATTRKPQPKLPPAPFPTGPRPLWRVPAPAGAYGSLLATKRALLVTDRRGDRTRRVDLLRYALKRDAKLETVLEGVRVVELSADGKKLMLRKGDELYVVASDVKGSLEKKKLSKSRVDLSAWRLHLDPREDWRQIFDDAWRLHRGWFYDPGMHGVDWTRMRDKYRPLVARVHARDELNDLIGQMIGELSALHSRASGGDRRRGVEDVAGGSLGARLRADPTLQGWRIEHVYAGDPERPDRRSPLARPDLALAPGDAITAVDGVPFTPGLQVDALLREKAGKLVRLSIKRKDGKPAPDALVEALSLSREQDLRYDEWEWNCKQRVERAGRGRIGYVHLRAMGASDIGTWFREFPPLSGRQGLVIDVRGNRGGNIDSWILGRLLRKAWFYWKGRTGSPTWNMQRAFRGHMVVLCNHRTASDGEAFAEGFRRLGLGKVIGTRTWGGEIWLSRGNRLVDRGVASAGETGVYGPDGTWLIEGHGVVPDIEVMTPPMAAFRGEDRQLDAAVQHLSSLIAADPRPVPPPPPYPDKSSADNRSASRGGR